MARVERSCGKPTPRAHFEGDEVPAARYPVADGGGEQHQQYAAAKAEFSAGRSLHPCRCGNQHIWDDSRLPRMRRDRDGEHSEESQLTVEGRRRPRANPEDVQDADPEPCSKMLRTISPVQSQVMTGTGISQVLVICRRVPGNTIPASADGEATC